MSLATIRIETNGSPTPKKWRVFLEGQEITQWVSGLRLSAQVGEVRRVYLAIPARLELPDEIKCLLTAEEYTGTDDGPAALGVSHE